MKYESIRIVNVSVENLFFRFTNIFYFVYFLLKNQKNIIRNNHLWCVYLNECVCVCAFTFEYEKKMKIDSK